MMIGFQGQTNKVKGNIRALKTLVNKIAHDHGATILTIDYILVDDAYLLELNNTALNHDYYTDIITFDYSENNCLEGEIYISTDRVLENSRKFNVAFHVELARVIFHGVLHMVGYKDKNQNQKNKMRTAENKYIEEYLNGVPRGTR